jgi:hypothetical protein
MSSVAVCDRAERGMSLIVGSESIVWLMDVSRGGRSIVAYADVN